MARNPSIYTGLQQGAATRRNRYLRAAHRAREALARYDRTPNMARGLASWELQIDGAFAMSDASLVDLVADLLVKRLAFCVERVRYHHREWKQWAARNAEWRAEMAHIDAGA